MWVGELTLNVEVVVLGYGWRITRAFI